MVIELPDEQAAALTAKAAAEGLSLEDWFRKLAAQGDTWEQEVDALMTDLPESSVVLSDEAMKRKNWYSERS